MAINTSGYRVQLPPIAQIPSNIGALDVGSGQQALLRGMQISKAAFGDPIEKAEKMRNYRTLLARAKQEDELREQETKAKRARLLSEEAMAPMDVESAEYRNQLSGQRVKSGELDLEVSQAEQPTRLETARQKGEETLFRGQQPVQMRVFGPAKETSTQAVRLPSGAVQKRSETSIVYGDGKKYTTAVDTEQAPAPMRTFETMEDAGTQGYVKVQVKDDAGNVIGEKYVPRKLSSSEAIVNSIAALRTEAAALRSSGDEEGAAALEAQADTISNAARSMRFQGMKPSAVMQINDRINELESIPNRTSVQDEELKRLKAQMKQDIGSQIESALGGGKPAANPAAAGKFKIVEVK